MKEEKKNWLIYFPEHLLKQVYSSNIYNEKDIEQDERLFQEIDFSDDDRIVMLYNFYKMYYFYYLVKYKESYLLWKIFNWYKDKLIDFKKKILFIENKFESQLETENNSFSRMWLKNWFSLKIRDKSKELSINFLDKFYYKYYKTIEQWKDISYIKKSFLTIIKELDITSFYWSDNIEYYWEEKKIFNYANPVYRINLNEFKDMDEFVIQRNLDLMLLLITKQKTADIFINDKRYLSSIREIDVQECDIDKVLKNLINGIGFVINNEKKILLKQYLEKYRLQLWKYETELNEILEKKLKKLKPLKKSQCFCLKFCNFCESIFNIYKKKDSKIDGINLDNLIETLFKDWTDSKDYLELLKKLPQNKSSYDGNQKLLLKNKLSDIDFSNIKNDSDNKKSKISNIKIIFNKLNIILILFKHSLDKKSLNMFKQNINEIYLLILNDSLPKRDRFNLYYNILNLFHTIMDFEPVFVDNIFKQFKCKEDYNIPSILKYAENWNYLVSWYRWTGKTSFIKNMVDEHNQNSEEQIIPIIINLPFIEANKDSKEKLDKTFILNNIIIALKKEIDEHHYKISNFSKTKIYEQYQRVFFDVKEKNEHNLKASSNIYHIKLMNVIIFIISIILLFWIFYYLLNKISIASISAFLLSKDLHTISDFINSNKEKVLWTLSFLPSLIISFFIQKYSSERIYTKSIEKLYNENLDEYNFKKIIESLYLRRTFFDNLKIFYYKVIDFIKWLYRYKLGGNISILNISLIYTSLSIILLLIMNLVYDPKKIMNISLLKNNLLADINTGFSNRNFEFNHSIIYSIILIWFILITLFIIYYTYTKYYRVNKYKLLFIFDELDKNYCNSGISAWSKINSLIELISSFKSLFFETTWALFFFITDKEIYDHYVENEKDKEDSLFQNIFSKIIYFSIPNINEFNLNYSIKSNLDLDKYRDSLYLANPNWRWAKFNINEVIKNNKITNIYNTDIKENWLFINVQKLKINRRDNSLYNIKENWTQNSLNEDYEGKISSIFRDLSLLTNNGFNHYIDTLLVLLNRSYYNIDSLIYIPEKVSKSIIEKDDIEKVGKSIIEKVSKSIIEKDDIEKVRKSIIEKLNLSKLNFSIYKDFKETWLPFYITTILFDKIKDNDHDKWILLEDNELDIDYNEWILLKDDELEKFFIRINSHVSKNENFAIKVNLKNWKINGDWEIGQLESVIRNLEEKWDNRTVEEEKVYAELKKYLEKLDIFKERFSYCIKSFFLLNNRLWKYYNYKSIKSLINYFIKNQDAEIKNDVCSIDCYNLDFRRFSFRIYIPYSKLGKNWYPKMEDLQNLTFKALSLPNDYIYENVIPWLIFRIYNILDRKSVV